MQEPKSQAKIQSEDLFFRFNAFNGVHSSCFTVIGDGHQATSIGFF